MGSRYCLLLRRKQVACSGTGELWGEGIKTSTYLFRGRDLISDRVTVYSGGKCSVHSALTEEVCPWRSPFIPLALLAEMEGVCVEVVRGEKGDAILHLKRTNESSSQL